MDLPLTDERHRDGGDWDPARILTSPAALDALRCLGRRLRRAGFVNRLGALQVADPDDRDLVELALGHDLAFDVAAALLGGTESARALTDSGGARVAGAGRLSLRFQVLSDGRAMAILPFPGAGGAVAADTVYGGADTWLLRDQVWRYGLGGRRAVDLGTGTGLVAAFLTARYDTVVATDVTPAAARTATLSRELLDEQSAARLHSVTADVAAGLRAGTFDLVCANTPWVPSNRARGRLYAEGGATGFEVPRRFLAEGAELLAPGGVLVALCAELVFVDGTRPLDETRGDLERKGYATTVEPTPIGHPFHRSTVGAAGVIAGVEEARHVTVVVHRPRSG